MAEDKYDFIWEIIETEGDFNNDPDDKGGPTKYGITISTFEHYYKKKATIEDIESLTKEQAYEIYYSMYVKEPGFLNIFDRHLRHHVVDCGVLHGPSDPIKWFQEIIVDRAC